jgi:3-methyladenine DNA glycosylase AlkD
VDDKLPEWKACREQGLARLKLAGLPVLLEACDLLVRPGKYEEVFTAIAFAADSSELYTPDFLARIGKWFETGIGNWAEVDTLAGRVLGPFLTKNVVGLDALGSWVESPWKYQRRAVPVTLIGLLKVTSDFEPLFRLIEPLMSDDEKVVRQGMGWFLREAWKKQPAPTEAFLLSYKDMCPRLIVQYATEKMDAAGKQRFKRAR